MKPAAKKKYQMNFFLAPHIAAKLKRDAKRRGMLLTSYVRMVLSDAAGVDR